MNIPTMQALVQARAGDTNVGLRFGDVAVTWDEIVTAASQRAAYLLDRKPTGDEPFHVGVLLDNTPEFFFMLCAGALSGATIVGINPTRRGAELERDIAHTDCLLIVTEFEQLELFEQMHPHTYFGDAWDEALEPYEGAGIPDVTVSPADPFSLIFTSGTTGAPKAVKMGHGRLAAYGSKLAEMFGLTAADNCYSVMPLFHSNAQVAGFCNIIASGGTAVLRRKFSASSWLPDVREHGVTFFNYVGKPLTYILATPEQTDDAENPLKFAFGNEAAPLDIERFAERFGCYVADGYGSTEGGLNMSRIPGTPRGSLGKPVEGVSADVRDPETGKQCPPAAFDANGRFLNADEAIGELVNPDGAGGFEGYYKNPEADAERVRDGVYWTGDLAYYDADGFYYFAGRNSDWLRVDGENFAAAPVETILARDPIVVLAAVYAVPSPDVGDEVMVALHLHEGAAFDGEAFAAFCAAQPDLSPKWLPRFVRVSHGLPSTATQKVLKRVLQNERWECTDEVWWRSGREMTFRKLEPEDQTALRELFAQRGREHLIGR
jgi:fatty-acyl-CoA synthase